MKEIIRKEYKASVDELKELFPVGTICYINNKTARVIEINEPMSTNCMASYPSVTFVVVEPDMSIDVNKRFQGGNRSIFYSFRNLYLVF
jgi:hypothetical protein